MRSCGVSGTWGHRRESSCPGEVVMKADDRYFSTMFDHWLTVNEDRLFGYLYVGTVSGTRYRDPHILLLGTA